MKWLMLMVFIANTGYLQAVVTDTHSDCNKIFNGAGGQILSPDFPEEYPDNLGCTWVIKTDVNSRIRIYFEEFQLEPSADCFDKLIVNDGIQQNSPSLGTFCGDNARGLTLTSSGNTMFLQFTTDESIGDNGINIVWLSIPRVSLNVPADPWKSLAAPKDILDFDAGYNRRSLWVIDTNYDIFYYNGKSWDIYAGKLQSITVGECGIFGINPQNKSLYWRQDASVSNPTGERWVLISRNNKGIRHIESASGGYIYGIDKKNILYFTHINNRNNLDNSWRTVNLDLEDEGGRINGVIDRISCGIYSCWVTMKSGVVYGMTTPSNPKETLWSNDYGNYKEVTSGFGDNVWSVNSNGNVFKKESVSSLRPLGALWKKQYGVQLKHIRSGLGGVFGINGNGDLAYLKDALCGGYLYQSKGTVKSPNYPSNYPPNQACLWVIKPIKAGVIDLTFNPVLDIKKQPLCGDYLVTSFPGITEPIVECGRSIIDKEVGGDQVWIEFVSNDNDEGVGFSAEYFSSEGTATTISPTATRSSTPVPSNWQIIIPTIYFGQNLDIKSTSLSPIGELWIIDANGRVYVKKKGFTKEISDKNIISITHQHGYTYALDDDFNLLRIQDSDSQWKIIERDSDYRKIYNGPNGMLLAETSSGALKYCTKKDSSIYLDCNYAQGITNIKTIISNSYGMWILQNDGETKFFTPIKKRNSNIHEFRSKTIGINLNDLILDNFGQVWGILQNGSIAFQQGVSVVNPYGLPGQWVVLTLVGDQLYTDEDSILVLTKDGLLLKQKAPVAPQQLPTGWSKLSVSSNLQHPHKVDAYPKGEKLDVWLLAGPEQKFAYQGEYGGNGNNVIFEKRGDVELLDISIGESGVWGLDSEYKARYYESVGRVWSEISNDDIMWRSIESASPKGNVYAIDFMTNQLYFRHGITETLPTGNEWVATNVYIKQITAGPYITYVIMNDGQLRSFSNPPTKDNLKQWRNSWRITDKIIDNKISMGFDGTLAYLSDDNKLLQRKPVSMKYEQDDAAWSWYPKLSVSMEDLSAGPVIFGISGKDILVKQVTPCYGFYDDVTAEITAQLTPGTDGNYCMWLVTTSPSKSILTNVKKSKITPSSSDCSSGGLYYSTNPRSPLLGNIQSYCSDVEFKEEIKGNRALYQYYKDIPSFTDELRISFTPKTDSVEGCNQILSGKSGTIKSPNYPQNYDNKEDCTYQITVTDNEKIEIVFVDGNIELGGALCDYDFLKLYDGDSTKDQLLSTNCGDITNKPSVLSSSNKITLHFKSDDTGTTKGFVVNWRAVKSSLTTEQPSTVSPTPYSACGGSLNSNNGLLASPNYPSNYENNLNCEWYITTEANSKIIFQIVQLETEQDTECLYDFLQVFDGIHNDAKSFGTYCGKRQDVFLKTNGNTLRVVLTTDSSTNKKGFLAKWKTEKDDTGTEVSGLPSGWEQIYKTDKATAITTNLQDEIWIVDEDNNIEVIFKDGSPKKATTIRSVQQISNGRLGSWFIKANTKDLYYIQPLTEAEKSQGKIPTNVLVTSPSDGENMKVISTMFNVYLIKDSNDIYIRDDITPDQPTGNRWMFYKKGKDIAESAYGIWIIGVNGDLTFLDNTNQKTSSVNSPLPNTNYQKVIAGFGNVVYVLINDEVYKRTGINSKNSIGLQWEETGVKNVKDIAVNNDGTYVVFKDNTMAKKEEIVCGGILQSKASYINYPEFDTGYKENQYCLWLIDVPGSQQINIEQRRFSLEDSADCENDRVTIFSPAEPANRPVACREGFDAKSMSFNTDMVFIEFISDNTVNKRGFALSYKALDETSSIKTTQVPTPVTESPGCSYTYTKSTGLLSSPNYPDEYGNNLRCVYRIRLNPGKRITLQFFKFALEKDNSCQFDSFKIYEIENEGNQQLAQTYCGVREIDDYQSKGNELDLVFVSDSSTSSQGFSLKYVDTDAAGITTPNTKYAYPPGWKEISTPSRTFMRLDASVESPTVWAIDLTGYPLYYDQNTNTWKDIDKPSQNLKLAAGKHGLYAIDKNKEFFFRFNSSSINIAGDYWGRIYNNNKQLIHIEYGANEEIIGVTTDNEIVSRVGITSDNRAGTSWKVIATGYTEVSVGTYGYWLKDDENNIYFATYVPSQDIYNMLNPVPINGKFKKVVAGFGGNVWALDRDSYVYKRLNVNSLNPSGTRWEKIKYNDKNFLLFDISAGYDAVYGIATTGRILRYSDTYCGGIYESSSGSLQSPSFPMLYPTNLNCLYIINTPDYDQLTVTFPSFDVEKSTDCYKDYILISLDGKYPSKYAVEKDCGSEMETKVFKNRAWFELHTDDTIEKPGFLAEWRAEKVQTTKRTTTTKKTIKTTTTTVTTAPADKFYRKCGGSLAGEEGIIVHPGYPNKYQNSQDCIYIITVAPNRIIQISFDELDIESSDSCNYDYVEIKDSFGKQRRLRYCKPIKYPDFISSGRNLVIRFYTDEVGQRKGFKLNWKAIPANGEISTTTKSPIVTTPKTTLSTTTTTEQTPVTDCNKVYKSYSGYIYQNNYPKRYKNNVNCLWMVQAPDGYKVRFEFKYFKLEQSLNCKNDYVAIYDGPDNASPLIGKYCGRTLPKIVESTGREMAIVLKTNKEITDQGMVILYKRIQTESVQTTKSTSNKDCKFYLSGDSGTLTHPGYPQKYAVDLDCYWFITTNENAKIQFTFEEFEIESAGKCNYDFVRMRDGDKYDGAELGKFCGNSLPDKVLSSTNKVSIRFRSDDRQTRRGFKLNWKAVYGATSPTTTASTTKATRCVKFLSGESGEITSPGFPNKYDTDINCHWFIETNDDTKIRITFVEMDIEKGPNCNYDFLRFHNGYSNQFQYPYKNNPTEEISKVCGKVLPNAVESTGNRIHVNFRSDDRQTRKGFQLKWSSVKKDVVATTVTTTKKTTNDDCNFKVNGNNGIITHPNYPNKYGKNQICTWEITVPATQVIEMSFIEFDVENAANCYYDYVALYNGKTTLGKQLGKFCGSTLPTKKYSSGNQMFMKFYSDDRQVRNGFKLQWKAVKKEQKECGGVYTTSGSTIAHATFPYNYLPNEDCKYIINAPNKYRIVLYFQLFELENSEVCKNDYVQISEGSDNEKQFLGPRYCGDKNPPTIRSEKGVMALRFKTNNNQQRKGFKATYYFELIKTKELTTTTTKSTTTTTATTATTKTTSTTSTTKSAGATKNADDHYRSFHQVSGNNGVINHYGYPSHYKNNLDSTWIITTKPGRRIKLRFNLFSLQRDVSCRFDYVEVYDSEKKSEHLIGRYCLDNPGLIQTTGHNMILVFHSDDRYTNSGFVGTWTTEEIEQPGYDICDSTNIQFNGDAFKLVSPGFPQDQKYPPNKHCVLHVMSKPGTVFEVQIRNFELEDRNQVTKECEDYVRIRDGDHKAKDFGKMCGNQLNRDTFYTTSNEIFIEFKSDEDVQKDGFHMHLETITRPGTHIQYADGQKCGQLLDGSNGQITNPLTVNTQFDSASCVWLVNTIDESQIKVTFSKIELSGNCDKSFIIIRDGGHSYSPMIGKYCGYKENIQLISNSNQLYIEYKTPTDNVGKFIMNWEQINAEDYSCGGTVTGEKGVISLPQYPSNSKQSIYCLWNVMVAPNEKISLRVEDMLLGDDCDNNYVIVRDGMTSQSKRIKQFCKQETESSLLSTGNSLWIEIRSSCSTNKVFRAFWSVVKNGEFSGKTNNDREKSQGQVIVAGGPTTEELPTTSTTTTTTTTTTTSTSPPVTAFVSDVAGSRLVTGESGSFHSPNFPQDYFSDVEKVWIIKGPGPGKIKLSFTHFNLEYDSACKYDYVQVRDGSNALAPIIGQFCGKTPPSTIESSENGLWIKFRSDSSTNSDGFKAKWSWTGATGGENTKACGAVFTEQSGQLSSPNHPQQYPENLDCVYVIKPTEGRKLKLDFNFFDLEKDSLCSYDFLLVRSGPTKYGKKLDKLCGRKLPNSLITNDGGFWLHFKSDSSTNQNGFKVSWSVIDENDA